MVDGQTGARAYAGAAGAGAVVGALMGFLVAQGNPGHMGICGACFLRDTAGALGFHRAAAVQYLRPETIGLLLGALAAALACREFRPRGGGAALFRFVLGVWVSVGALVFLGCPFRMLQRLGGGDLGALAALGGLIVGIWVALRLVTWGIAPGRTASLPSGAGLLLPVLAVAALAALVLRPSSLLFSEKGPGSQHAAWALSLGVAAMAGVLLQRLRFCTLGAVRGALFLGDRLPAAALAGIVVAYGVVAASTGRFRFGLEGQPIAHADLLWSTLSMVLVGLAASLAGGCPVRQVVLAGEGDADAGVTVLGLLVGGALAHNLDLASSPAGPTAGGKVAVVVGFAFCLGAALLMRTSAGGSASAVPATLPAPPREPAHA